MEDNTLGYHLTPLLLSMFKSNVNMFVNYKMPLIVCIDKIVDIYGIVFLLCDWWTRDGGRDMHEMLGV